MPVERFTLKEKFESFRDDNAELLSEPSKTLWKHTINSLISGADIILRNPLNPTESVLDLKFTFEAQDMPELPSLSPPDSPITPGGDPIKPLNDIATAIGSAENILNADNLVISQAAVEVNMSVGVPGVAGANTTIKFGVEPRSM